MSNRQKNYTDMNLDELRAATAEFNTPTTGRELPGTELTSAERRKFERIRRGRPRRGKGVRVISLSVEKELLEQADARAKAEGISRARLVEEALRVALQRRGRICETNGNR